MLASILKYARTILLNRYMLYMYACRLHVTLRMEFCLGPEFVQKSLK